jgi:hypothetical protein
MLSDPQHCPVEPEPEPEPEPYNFATIITGHGTVDLALGSGPGSGPDSGDKNGLNYGFDTSVLKGTRVEDQNKQFQLKSTSLHTGTVSIDI